MERHPKLQDKFSNWDELDTFLNWLSAIRAKYPVPQDVRMQIRRKWQNM